MGDHIAMLAVEEVSKYYGAHAAIAGLTFAAARGEVVGLLGLNGAGKTTLLRLVAGLLHPSHGRITLDGDDLYATAAAVRGRIGFLPEVPPLHPEMRVADFVAFAHRLRGGGGPGAGAQLAAALEATALTEVAQQPIATLSHGFRRRVGLAQAIVHRPALLLLDEPTAGLDPVQVVQMRKLIAMQRGAATTLISSHDLAEISELCDTILVIDRGGVVAAGSEGELAARVRAELCLVISARGSGAALAAAVRGVAVDIDARIDGEEDGLVRATLTMQHDHSAAIAAAIVGAGLGLVHLERRRVPLSGIFLALAQPGHGELP